MKTIGAWVAGVLAVCALGATSRAGEEAWSAGDAYPTMTWELAPRSVPMFAKENCGLASLKECGFTVAGFVRPEQLKECERLGLKAIVCEAGGQMQLKDKSDEEIDQAVKKLVDEAGDSPAVIGYFLRDEPGVQEYANIAKAVAAVKRYAPGKLAYVNLLPDYATLGAPNLSQLGTESYSEYLERFVAEVKPQLISYDNYRVQFSGDLKDAKVAASYYNNLLEVRRVALKNGLPFWNIVNCNEIRPHTPVPSPANLQFQAYTTLAAGAKGLTWFKYYQVRYRLAPVDDAGNRTVAWSYLKMVNDQVKVLGPVMKPLTSTGVYFSDPAPVAGLPLLPGKLVRSVKCDAPVMVGEFDGPGGGSQYVMVVNLSLSQSSKVTLEMADGRDALKVISPVDASATDLPADHAVWLTAGQGALLKLP